MQTATSVLLIEDDVIDQQVIKRFLEQSTHHYRVDVCDDLSSALETLAKRSYEVIITDLRLPDSSEFEAVRRLVALDLDTALLICSGNDDTDLHVDVVSLGADDFVFKAELTSSMLHRCVQQNIRRLQQRRKIRRLNDEVKRQNDIMQGQAEELRQKNKRLERLYDAAQKFVNNVSHEFRTPLCVIKQYSSLISDGIVGEISDEQVRLLRIIEDRVDGLNNMVDDMLDINRLESGLLAAHRGRCSAMSIVEPLLPGLRQRAAIRKVEIEVRAGEDLPMLYCDSEKAGRTLINLITNAIKFSPDGGTVTVRIRNRANDGEVVFDVEDQGVGIEEDQKQLIFQRFQQGSQGIASDVKGFGLGLHIARELVDLNLGELSVQSVPGCGSTFSFSVPTDGAENLVRRYGRRLVQNTETDSAELVCLSLTCRSADPAAAKINQEVEHLLSVILRCDDLSLGRHGADAGWTILLRCRESDVSDFEARLSKEIATINRNRPDGPLPELVVASRERFSIPTQLEDLIRRFDASSSAIVPPAHFDVTADATALSCTAFVATEA